MNVSRESRSSAQASLRRRARCSRSATDTLSNGETNNPMLVILPAEAFPIHLQTQDGSLGQSAHARAQIDRHSSPMLASPALAATAGIETEIAGSHHAP